ncbi:uncharacterized protein LOC109836839 isoform X2 [Asparagus officinalis]|uniref:uncharacterized protein LOC109836839 isoform X2 n=1 Tax=Asparagus officinalis TaxID=4686 RepID=UPI00098E86A4|nr:uncharacterized protein LOC109836839 isoform X2 [Asparagus officinalis]
MAHTCASKSAALIYWSESVAIWGEGERGRGEMGRREGGDRRRRIGKPRREIDGKAIVPAMPLSEAEVWPEWLPAGWTIELKKRKSNCLSKDKVDRYYVCPLSGKRYRSRLEVMRLLNNEMHDRPSKSSKVVHYRPSMSSKATHDRPSTSSKVVKGERPEWLPEGWLVEFRQRRVSRVVDKYYICALSGIRLRSRVEVMRFLANQMLEPPASGSFSSDELSQQLIGYPASGSTLFDEHYKQLVTYPASGSTPSDEHYKPLATYPASRSAPSNENNEKYYIDPTHGYGLRSKKDVSRYLENKDVCRIAFRRKRTHTPDELTLKEEFLPLSQLKKSKMKRSVVRRRLFARDRPISNATMDINFANSPQKSASSCLSDSSAQYIGESEIGCSALANVEPINQMVTPFQIEWQPNPAFSEEEIQAHPTIKMLPGPESENLSLMQQEGETLAIPDANPSEEKQFELINKQRCAHGEEIQELSAIKFPQGSDNEKLREPLIQLEGERLILDANLSEEEQFDFSESLSQVKRRIQPNRCGIGEEKRIQLKSCCIGEQLQGESAVKLLQGPQDDKLSKPLMPLGEENLLVPDANLLEDEQLEILQNPQSGKPLEPLTDASHSEEKQIEMTETLSQLKRRRPRGSKNTEAAKSITNQPRLRKRKAEKTDTVPVRTSKRLAGSTAVPISNSGIGNQSRRIDNKKTEQAQLTVSVHSDANCDLSMTDELQEKLQNLNPFVESDSQQEKADKLRRSVPKDSDASCRRHQKDTPITNNLLEKLEKLMPPVGNAPQNQKANVLQPTVPKDSDANCLSPEKDTPETDEIREKLRRLEPFAEKEDQTVAALPFRDSWFDPCIEFAFKTLTSDFPVFEDITPIQVYLNPQLKSSQIPNLNAGSIPFAVNGHSSGNGKVSRDRQEDIEGKLCN